MNVTERWLRLMAVSSLPGEQMLQVARALPETALSELLTARQIKQFLAVEASSVADSLRWLEEPDHYLLTADDPRYPPLLKETVHYPGALLVAGHPEVLHSPQLGVVGSRSHSWYGEQWGRQFSEQLAASGLTITSGLAVGIDSLAHQAALAGRGYTVAVLGNGLRQIYPKRNQALAERIIGNGGALVSEFPLATTPWPGNFPRRNRIISGLSLGVLVVEASMRSGSLVTARCALEQDREVFVLPGPLGNPQCEGNNWLIKQGATPVTHPQEIISQLQALRGWLAGSHLCCPAADSGATQADSEQAAQTRTDDRLLSTMSDEVTPVDVIAQRSGLALPAVITQLLDLELAGQIASVPGGYVRVRRLAGYDGANTTTVKLKKE